MIQIKLLHSTWSRYPDRRGGENGEPVPLFTKKISDPTSLTVHEQEVPTNNRDKFLLVISTEDLEHRSFFKEKWNLYLGWESDAEENPDHYLQPERLGDTLFYMLEDDLVIRNKAQMFFEDIVGKVRCRLKFDGKTVLTWTHHAHIGDESRSSVIEMRSAIANLSSELLVNIHGKSIATVSHGHDIGILSSPIVELQELPRTFDILKSAIRFIQRKPHSRMIPRLVRQAVYHNTPITEYSLQELTRTPDILIRLGSEVLFRENIVEITSTTHDRPENQMILGFLRYLEQRCPVLRTRLKGEIKRQEAFVNGLFEGDWQEEEKCQLKRYGLELEKLGKIRQSIRSEWHRLAERWEIKRVSILSQKTTPTPIIRKHKGYSDAYRIMNDYFSRFRLNVENEEEPQSSEERDAQIGMIKLSKMYEYWCLLHLFKVFRERLDLQNDSQQVQNLLLESRTDWLQSRFVEEPVEFHDNEGKLLRFFYEKRYYATQDKNCLKGTRYGKPRRQGFWCPDFSLEFFAGSRDMPTKIIFFDAKYAFRKHGDIRDGVRKYQEIDAFDPNQKIFTQTWALTFNPPSKVENQESLHSFGRYTTTEPSSFWDRNQEEEVVGTIQVQPNQENASHSPFRQLIDLIFGRLGISCRNENPKDSFR